jgi:Skp family chaperone for outer membrane proteins
MDQFEEIYEQLQRTKGHFDEIKGLFDESDTRLDEIRKRHEAELINLFRVIERRDEESREYIEKREHKELGRLLEDIQHLIDRLYTIHLKLIEEEKDIVQKRKK